jgi:hypothetical protein
MENVQSKTEYKIFTEGDWSGVYFRSRPNEDWIFLTEYFGAHCVEDAEAYLERLKNEE